jgi:hypothetical protein
MESGCEPGARFGGANNATYRAARSQPSAGKTRPWGGKAIKSDRLTSVSCIHVLLAGTSHTFYDVAKS